MENLTVETIREQLKEVIDPELGINVVDLGLIYDIHQENGQIQITMTLTTPGCPLHDTIVGGVRAVLKRNEHIKHVDVNLVWTPPWNPSMISEKARTELGF